MEQHFNTPSEVIDTNMKAGEGKAHLPLRQDDPVRYYGGCIYRAGRSHQQHRGTCH